MTLYFKWTAEGRVPSHRGGRPIPVGRWTQRVTDPVLCERGWHACRWEDVPAHVAAELWACELDGQIVEGGDKVVAERLKLVERIPVDDVTFRLWAADCAEAVLYLFEGRHPDDDRPRKAIEVARAFARGEIDEAARSAALSAARSAAESAAESAAWSAAWSAWSAALSAAESARSAAESAAESAAWSAAESAARSAARSAQADRLLGHYLGLNPADYAHRSTP